MTQNANPSINPADLDSIIGAFAHILKKTIQNLDGAMPAKVLTVDRIARPNTVSVQPMLPMYDTNKGIIPRAPIAAVPVIQMGAGGFIFNFNLNPGDQGIILAMDRDISQYIQSLGEAAPNEFRMKNFSDSYFLPCVLKGYTLAPEDAQNLVLQSLDGSVKIALGTNKIKIEAPTVEIDSDTVAINASTEVNITSPKINIDADTNVVVTTPLFATSENITAGGTITPNVPPP